MIYSYECCAAHTCTVKTNLRSTSTIENFHTISGQQLVVFVWLSEIYVIERLFSEGEKLFLNAFIDVVEDVEGNICYDTQV